MKVVFEHPTELPVKAYGGTERILFWLMRELVRQGHEVSLIGHPQSRLAEYGIKLIPNIEGARDWRTLIPIDTDVLHVFAEPPGPVDVPYVVTIGGNGKPGETFLENTVFVSKKHAELHGSSSFVHNGIDFSEYPFKPKAASERRWRDFMFLAKASWKVKNLKHCIRACKVNQRHLHIAGGRAWLPSRYVHNHGMVGQAEKNQILAKCDALLFPVRWHEPFGIAVIEAFAAGLPVIGSPFGSLPELINPRVGVICQNYDELVEAVREKKGEFLPEEIRAYVEQNFGIDIIAKRYVSLYERVLRGEKLNGVKPRATFQQDPQTLLPF